MRQALSSNTDNITAVLIKIEQQDVSSFKGKTANLGQTYTNDFAAKVPAQ